MLCYSNTSIATMANRALITFKAGQCHRLVSHSFTSPSSRKVTDCMQDKKMVPASEPGYIYLYEEDGEYFEPFSRVLSR